MIILVTSDIHGDIDSLEILRKTEHFDIHIDAGDSNLSLPELKNRQIISVKGNTDFFTNLPLIRILENEVGKIMVVHGHHHGVKSGLNILYLAGLEQRANLVVYGHTHIQRYEVIDGLNYLNPGSLKFSKQYAIIDNNEVILKEL